MEDALSSQVAMSLKQASGLASAQSGKKTGNLKDVHKSAEDFESMFLSQMLSPMWEGVESDPTFGGGHGEEAFRSLMINEYGKTMTKAGGIGITKAVQAEMIRIQEGKH